MERCYSTTKLSIEFSQNLKMMPSRDVHLRLVGGGICDTSVACMRKPRSDRDAPIANRSMVASAANCLNEHWFISLAHAQLVIESWRLEYNDERPKKSLGGLTPAAYAKQVAKKTVTATSDSNSDRY